MNLLHLLLLTTLLTTVNCFIEGTKELIFENSNNIFESTNVIINETLIHQLYGDIDTETIKSFTSLPSTTIITKWNNTNSFLIQDIPHSPKNLQFYVNLVHKLIKSGVSIVVIMYHNINITKYINRGYQVCEVKVIQQDDKWFRYHAFTSSWFKHCDFTTSTTAIDFAADKATAKATAKGSVAGSFIINFGATWHVCVEYSNSIEFPGCPVGFI